MLDPKLLHLLHTPAHAAALYSVSHCLGQLDEAFNANRDAVELYWHLAVNDPTGFNPTLAASLIRLSDSRNFSFSRRSSNNKDSHIAI